MTPSSCTTKTTDKKFQTRTTNIDWKFRFYIKLIRIIFCQRKLNKTNKNLKRKNCDLSLWIMSLVFEYFMILYFICCWFEFAISGKIVTW